MAYATLPLISRQLNTLWLAPLDSLLLYLIHRSLFLFRLSFPYFPFVIPVPPSVIPAKAGIQEGLDPQSEALRFRLRMTKNVSFPQPSLVIPVKTGIQSVISGSPIRSALLSVEDDKGGSWLRMTKNVSFPQPSLVIPVKTGIQIGLDPQSEALCFRLRMTRGFRLGMTRGCVIPAPLPSFPRKRESRQGWIPNPKRFAFG